MTDPREIEALCAEAEGTLHPAYPVRTLALRMATALRALAAENAALRADKERLVNACASAVAEGRKRVDESLAEFGYDSMEFAECRAAWHACIDGLRAHIDQGTVTDLMRSVSAIDAAKGGV